jgi:hypothetical protein
MVNTAPTGTGIFVCAFCSVTLLYACTFDPAPMPIGSSGAPTGPASMGRSATGPAPVEARDPIPEPATSPADSAASSTDAAVSCPLDCDDGDPCTRDDRGAGEHGCDFACSHTAVLVAQNGDQCCPAAATSADDTDCMPVPGCGNGIVDPGEECDGSEGCSAGCQRRFDDSLIHRYSFDGHSRVVLDSVGDAHGVVIRGELEGKGMLELRGAPEDAYVELPRGLLGTLTCATLEAWFTPTGDANGQRLFDIGTHVRNEDGMAQSTSYWALSPNNIVSGTLLMRINLVPAPDPFMDDRMVPGSSPLNIDTQYRVNINSPYHVAAVLDATTHETLLYVNGTLQASTQAIEGDLSSLADSNVWLGRSQLDGYPYLSAQLDEFRVYDGALSASAISRSFAAGPNP